MGKREEKVNMLVGKTVNAKTANRKTLKTVKTLRNGKKW